MSKRKRGEGQSAVLGKKSRLDAEDEEDDDLGQFIHSSIAKRDIKAGTHVIKNAKGKIAKGEVGGGSFQSMGLHPSLLRALTLQGYRIPTPIQRLSIPALLANPPQDLVGMARTGSGKSLAYMLPLVQRLGGRHSTAFGARALILLPTRELALQILKVGKELARSWHSGQGSHAGDKDEDSEKGQNLRWGLVVGGEGLDDQFEMISNNPDVIIATPGRLLHLIVEMTLDLKSIQYVVFDEADRLFEMGFDTALNEILHRLPSARQTVLLSATLPKSLVEFAKAGLQNPKLVRLDAESKISSDLRMAFFYVKQAEKDACLLSLLRDVIKIPINSGPKDGDDNTDDKEMKRKAKPKHSDQVIAPHQSLIFTATKHHVEYLNALLTTAGYSVSHIYGSLDQGARTQQMDRFRKGLSSLLVVTDVAARGIDIPILQNVVNYDFPQGARVFVHRVGRTARAGRQGWAWSFVNNTELPHLLDLQLFLGRPLRSEVTQDADRSYIDSLILGTFERMRVDEEIEYARSLDDINHSLPTLREVMKRGHIMYERSKGKASPQSYKRAKDMMKDPKWALTGSEGGVHPVLYRGAGERRKVEEARKSLLQAVNSFRPAETVFEVGAKNSSATAALMKERRKALSKSRQRAAASELNNEPEESEDESDVAPEDFELADEKEIATVFEASDKRTYRDPDFYLSHYQKDAQTDKGYSLRDDATFAEQARSATFDLAGDETIQRKKRHQLTWDKKKKKFTKGDGAGADNVKLVKTESGTKLPASYRSGRYDEWKSKTRSSLPRVGEAETPGRQSTFLGGRRKFKHTKTTPAKPLDKQRSDYERKARQITKRESSPGPQSTGQTSKPGNKQQKGSKRHPGKSFGKVKSELKTVDQIRRTRRFKDQRKAKNARSSRKKR